MFSSGSLFIAIIFLIRIYSGKDPLSQREWLLLLGAGGVYTLVLMFSALGLLPFDLYALGYGGYGQRWFIALLALCAGGLAMWGSVLAWWLIAACALWLAGAVPSGNINDTLTDVFFLVLCLVILARKLPGLRKPGSV